MGVVILVLDLLEVRGTELPRLEVGPGTLEVRERVEVQGGLEPAVVEVQEVMEQVMEVGQEEMEEAAETAAEAEEMELKRRKVLEVVAQITETKEVAEETGEERLEEEDPAREVRGNLEEENPEEEDVQTVFWRLVLMLVLEPVPRSLVLV